MNFAYLKDAPDFIQLYTYCCEAEEFALSKPNISVTSARKAMEFVVKMIYNAVGGDIFLSVISMITLSFIISICSSIDAFFALAYVRNFTTGSILSFLLFGPMIDIKMITLLKTTFRWKFIATITLTVFILSLIVGLGVNLYVR